MEAILKNSFKIIESRSGNSIDHEPSLPAYSLNPTENAYICFPPTSVWWVCRYSFMYLACFLSVLSLNVSRAFSAAPPSIDFMHFLLQHLILQATSAGKILKTQ